MSLEEQLNDGFQMSISTDDGDIWIKFTGPNHSGYRVRIGAGGAISNLLNNEGVELLSPSFRDEKTDRIVQWTWWSGSLANPISGLPDFEYRYNVTQGGDMAGIFTPSQYVELKSNGIDVYSTPIDNWKAEQQSHFSGGFASLTRYRVIGPGLLLVRRVILINKVYLNGVEGSLRNSYVESWTPVKRGPYNAYALGVSGTKPNWWYIAGSNIPSYPNTPVASTNGYALAYDANDTESGEVFGLAFGKRNPEIISSGTVNPGVKNMVLNSMTWDTGFGILPAVNIDCFSEGDMLDVTQLIVLGKGITEELMNVITTYQSKLPAPKLWKHGCRMNQPEQEILDNLKGLKSQSGIRTDHLARLIKKSDSEPEPKPESKPEVKVCDRCSQETNDLEVHEIPCYCRALLEWDHSGRKTDMPKFIA